MLHDVKYTHRDIMDVRWFVLLYIVGLASWLYWVYLQRNTYSEPFEAPGEPTCRFVGSEQAEGVCPAHLSRRVATLGHAGAELRCDADGKKAASGEPARITAEVQKGRVVRLRIDFPGTGYTAPPKIEFHGGVGSGAEAICSVQDGRVTDVRITQSGYGYLATPSVEVEPPAPTFSFCHLCCAPDPLRTEFAELRDRYEALERILLEADVETPQRAGVPMREVPQSPVEPTGKVDEGMIERKELADDFAAKLRDYVRERSEEIQKAKEFLGVIQKQQEREAEMQRMAALHKLENVKPMYPPEYVAKIQWIADTQRRVDKFLASANANDLANCARRWNSYTTTPANLRPFEEQCAAFPRKNVVRLPPADPENFDYPPPEEEPALE